MANKTIFERWTAVRTLSAVFSEKGADLQQVKVLKEALCKKGIFPNWKGALLGASSPLILDIQYLHLDYSNSLAVPIKMEGRTNFFSHEAIQTACGSTFATNKANRVGETKDHILDAMYGCRTQDGGFALAVSDGSGGHFGDPLQDKRIARAAHFAAKASVRFFAAHNRPEELKSGFGSIIEALKQEILYKAKGESSTLVCCRAFPVKEGYRIVGFNIGDNMVIAWDPAAKKVHHLLPSRCSEAGTALLPNPCRKFEIEEVDALLPEGSFLYLMTDGVHDTLPYLEEEKAYPNQLAYKVRTLKDPEALFENLSADSSPKHILQNIVEKCFEGSEHLRLQQREANVQIGDDFSLVQCHLTKYTPTAHR
jgi:serine/threonine protein phosphatase PrpC